MTSKNSALKSPLYDRKFSLKSPTLKNPTVIPNQKSVEKSMRPLISPTGGELSKKFSMPQMSPRVEALLNNGIITSRNSNLQKGTTHHASSASLSNKEQYELREHNVNTAISSNPSRIYSSPRAEDRGKIPEKPKNSQPIGYSPSKVNGKSLHKPQKERNIALSSKMLLILGY